MPGEGSAAPGWPSLCDASRSDSGPPGYAVDPAGHAPARLAAHCYLVTGGPGAATPHALFGRPRLAFATRKPSRFATYVFAKGEYVACGALWVLSRAGKVPRPPAGGRNLSRKTDFLWLARERPPLSFCSAEGFASAEATKRLSDRPLETFGADVRSLLQITDFF